MTFEGLKFIMIQLLFQTVYRTFMQPQEEKLLVLYCIPLMCPRETPGPEI